MPKFAEFVLVALLLAVLGACIAPGSAGSDADAIAAAIADPRRPAADRARDAARKPAAVLEFAGVRPGQTVLDLFAGGGYYTELLAYAVGPSGRVVAYNNLAYQQVAGAAIEQRYADGRLSGVEQLVSENNALQLPDRSFDVALVMLSYHDVYFLDGDRGWTRIDRPRMLATLHAAIKPGGRVIVVDHVGRAGMSKAQGRALHRIDPAYIRADFEAAGFRLDAQSDALANPNDNLDVIAMAPEVRGKTDRAMLRFVKPL